MSQVSMIDKVYNLLLIKKKNLSFDDIWNTIKKNLDKKNLDVLKAELYTELVLDNRFALIADSKWGLRDYLKFDDIKKQFDYVDKLETTEEYDDTEIYHNQDSQVETKQINLREYNDKLKSSGSNISGDDFIEEETNTFDDDQLMDVSDSNSFDD